MGKDLKGKELGDWIVQRKDGSYCARYTNRFGKRISIYRKTLAELKTILKKSMSEDNLKINLVDEGTTLNEWYEMWMSVHKKDVIRDSTKATYNSVYQKHIKPILGHQKLKDITTLKIKSLINDISGNRFGFETQNKVRILLLDMFSKAQLDDFVAKNPARGIKVTRSEDEDCGDVNVLSVKEQTLFFDCCKGTFYNNFFIVAVTSGLRIGELAALTEEDIDLDKGLIRVSKTLLYQKLEWDIQKEFHIHKPKTKSSYREVPISEDCRRALKKQIVQKRIVCKKRPKKVPDELKDFLFTTRFNTPLNSQTVCDAIDKIVEEINLTRDELEEMESFSCHAFRHTFATRCIESEIQPRTVQAFLGHATLDMTMRLYVSVLDDHKKAEIEKLPGLTDEIFDDEDDDFETNILVFKKA